MRIRKATTEEKQAWKEKKELYPLFGFVKVKHTNGKRSFECAVEYLGEGLGEPNYEAHAPDGMHFYDGDALHTMLGTTQADLLQRLGRLEHCSPTTCDVKADGTVQLKETAVNTDTLRAELTTDNTLPRTAEQLAATIKALLNGRKFTGDTASVRRRQRTEETIVLATAQVLLDAGFLLGVYDGEETTLEFSRDIKAVQKALFTTDEDYLYVYVDADQDDPTNGVVEDRRPDFWVRCTYGNDGYDVISDYCSVDDLDKYLGEGSVIEKLTDLAEEGNL